MKSPKLFITVIFFISVLLLVLDLPQGVYFKNSFARKQVKSQEATFNPSDINIELGPLQIKKQLAYKLGLDLQGGTKLTYSVDMTNIPASERDSAFDAARNIIERRVNFFGVTEPTIQTLKLNGDYRIAVELPGLSDINQALDLIGKTAQLSFWEAGPYDKNKPTSTASAALYPPGMIQVLGPNPVKTELTGKELKSAKVGFDSNNGSSQVQLNFSSKGGKQFGDITQRNVGKPVVIVLDNQIVSYPTVQQAILNGNAVITGNFNQNQSKQLAIQLNGGALPAPLKIIGQSTVGATLGVDSLKKSLLGGLVGFLSIVIFMIFLYRKEGFLACIALIIYTLIVLFIFKLFSITLTLAGIAGLILSIGMAVDANILIFERMREESRLGKPKDIALRLGFTRAWSSIRDSNISSLITSFILYYFGSGIIRGFAIALAIGILVSMFSAIMVTKNLLLVFDNKAPFKIKRS